MNTPAAMPVAYRILIVDDAPTIHEDFRKILTPLRAVEDTQVHDFASALFGAGESVKMLPTFLIDSATQGEEGLALLLAARAEGRPYSLAFVDMRMPPGWDGIETIRHLWAEDPALQVVICTAYSDTSWEQTIRVLGNSDNLLILKKPFDNIEALQLAHALTRKWSTARQHELQLASLDETIHTRTMELHAAEERFSLAFDASPLPQVIQNLATGRIIAVNSAHEKFTGLSRDVFLQASGGCFGPEDGSAEWTPLIAQLRAKQPVDEWPFTYRAKGQSPRELRCSGRPVVIEGNLHAAWVFRDVSDQLQLEQQFRQAQKMEAVGQLAAGVAHDFNNLLTVILSFTSLALEDTSISVDQRTGLGQVLAAGHRAASLTRQLLVFSRLQITKPEPLNVAETLGNLREMLSRLLPERIELEWHCADTLPTVLADAANLEQIVMNLIVNARDAIHGHGSIRLSLEGVTLGEADVARHADARAGRFLRLALSDDGCGMEPATLAHIFEPFYTTKDVGKGTGLGLSTVYGMVHQHEGWLEVASTPGKGSLFEIFLPALPGEPVPRVPTDRDPLKPAPGDGEHILLVEDETSLRNIAGIVLTRAGYTVTKMADGPSALRAYADAARPVDLLLTDIVMPNGMNGIELATQLRERQAGLKIILSTGYSDEFLRGGANAMEATHLLLKPYTNSTLLEMIRVALKSPAGAQRYPVA